MRATRTAALVSTAVLTAAALAAAPASGRGRSPATRVPLTAGPTVVLTEFPPANENSAEPYALVQADRAGVVTALWQHNGLWSAQRGPGGTWSSPVTVGACPTTFANCILSYGLLVDDNGNATAAWSDWDGGSGGYGRHVYVASQPAAGTWTVPQLLATGRAVGDDPWLSTGRNGAVLLTYTSWSKATGKAVAAVYKAPGGSWATARTRRFRHSQQAAGGVADNGTAVIVVRDVNRRDNQLRSYRYRPGHGWGPAHRLGIARHHDRPPYNLAVAPNGRAVLAYLYDPTKAVDVVGKPILKVRTMTRLGHWSAAHNLSVPGAVYTETPLVAFRTTPTVLWSTNHGAIREATKTPGRPWRVRTAYPRGTGDVSVLERNFRGDLVLLWQHWDAAAGATLHVGLRTYAGQWSQPLTTLGGTEHTFAWGAPVSLPDGSALVSSNGRGGTPPAVTYQVIIQPVAPAD